MIPTVTCCNLLEQQYILARYLATPSEAHHLYNDSSLCNGDTLYRRGLQEQ